MLKYHNMNKIEEYKQSQKEWRDISINQLSNANNVLITFSSALLVFILGDSGKNKIYFESSKNFDFNIITYWFSVLLLSFSIIYGFSVLVSRLYDARISRHIVLTRQRFCNEHKDEDNDKQELPRNDFPDFNFCDRVEALWRIMFCKLPLIKSERISKREEITDDFQNLRRISKILGTATWKWTKIQFILFLFSGFVYIIYSL